MTVRATRVACRVAIGLTLGSATSLHAQSLSGTWVKQTQTGDAGAMTMTVEPCCNNGHRLIYRIAGSDMVLTVESRFDGTDAAVLVNGKPSGETMGIKRLDDHHTTTILKMNGNVFGTSNASLSSDGKTLTVENDFTSAAGGQPIGKRTETWVRQ